jgi:membrane fusion protein (multidrug efflux system)
MSRKMLVMLAVMLVLFGGIFGWKWFVGRKRSQAMAGGAPLVTVSSTIARNETWHSTLYAVGTLRAIQGTDVTPQVDGQVAKIEFESGQSVQTDDVLITLDDSIERAQLEGLEATEILAKANRARIEELSKTQVVSPSARDQAEATYKQARAAVASQKELISKKTIRAPFSGMVGIRQVNLGDYLEAGAKIVSLQSLDPIYVDFSLPQEHLSQLRTGEPVALAVDAFPDITFSGQITAIESKVSEATRNIPLQATLANTGLKLRPGMFGTVSVELPDTHTFVTLPETAITYNPYGDSVFVIQSTEANGEKTLTVRRAFVQTGQRRGTQVAIVKGVEPGQQIVTAGQMKLQEGSRVEINNSVTPPDQPTSMPPNEH